MNKSETIKCPISYDMELDSYYLDCLILCGIGQSISMYASIIKVERNNSKENTLSGIILDGGTITIKDEDEEITTVNLKDVLNAIQICAKEYPHIFKSAILDENYDSISADVIMQIAAFGSIIYG